MADEEKSFTKRQILGIVDTGFGNHLIDFSERVDENGG
jgi:hypothetical protein